MFESKLRAMVPFLKYLVIILKVLVLKLLCVKVYFIRTLIKNSK
jgi:hypothetical protein